MAEFLKRGAPILALVALLVMPALATSGDTVPAPPDRKAVAKAAEPAEPAPDCSEPLRDDGGKPTTAYDPRCTPEMVEAAKAKKKAQSYDLEKLEGLEGLGEKTEAGSDADYGTLEDLFGVGRFDAGAAYGPLEGTRG